MRIIAPLGTVSVAAHSFAITAEGLCYMPGYGIQSAAATLVGQSVGAGRKDLTHRLGWIITGLSMVIMTLSAAILYVTAPLILGIMTPDAEVVTLAASVLRIVIFVEPLFGASIVATGVFQGAGNTLPATLMDLLSMWGLRIPLAIPLVARYGLRGAWIAMTVELTFRGAIFLLRLAGRRWLPREQRGAQ
jgi:Na+-driven multidrug efflux pump